MVVSRASDIIEGDQGQREMALEWQAEELELDPVVMGRGAEPLCSMEQEIGLYFGTITLTAVSKTNSGGAPWRNGGR